jgi:uncharacterized coiled-coil protein SlyX
MPTDFDSLALNSLESRMKIQEAAMNTLRQDVLTLKQSLDSNTEALKDMIELSKNFKIGLKFLGVLETIAVFIAKIAGACVILWAMWKFAISEAFKQIPK